MFSPKELPEKNTIIRSIQENYTKRNLERNDGRDFLLRSRLLNFNFDEPMARERFDLTLKTILITAYPEIFIEDAGIFQLNPSVPDYQNALLHRAFGIPVKKTPTNFTLNWNKFDYTAFEELFTQDTNPLWLVMKHLIPIGTTTPHISGRGESAYTPDEKIKTYIQLAEAFKAGSATKTVQTITNIFSSFSSRLGLKPISYDGIIKTPGVDKAIKGVLEMAENAIKIAKLYPECFPQVQAAFMPQISFADQSSESLFDDLEIASENAQSMALNQSNFGNWILINGKIYDPKTNYIQKFIEIVNPEDSKPKEVVMDDSLPNSELINKLEGIIDSFKSCSPESTKGQKREVAQYILSYLKNESTWFEVKEIMRANPDWNTPAMVFIGKSELIDIVNEIEQNPIAAQETRFFIELEKYGSEALKIDLERFKSQLRGGRKQDATMNRIQIQHLERKSPGIQPLLESLAIHIEEHHRETPESNRKNFR